MAARKWKWLIAGILAGSMVIAANIALMAVSGWFITSMAVAGVSKAAFNYALPAVAIRALAIVRTLGRYAERLVNHEAAFRMLADLRSWLFERLIPLAPAGLEGYAGGDLSGRLRSDVDNMESLYLRIIAPILTGFTVVMLAPLSLSLWSSTAALILLSALLAAGVALPFAAMQMSARPGAQSVILAGELRTAVTEGLQGAEELLLLGAHSNQAEKVEALYTEVAEEQVRLGEINGLVSGGVAAAGGIAIAALLTVAAMEISGGELNGPEMVMLLLFSAAAFEGIAPLAGALQSLPATCATALRLTILADAAQPVPEPVTPIMPDSGHGIIFSGVNFAYRNEASVLSNFSLAIPEGSRIALTGRSGSGKSSLIELLLRLRPYDGSITIGGIELREIPSDQICTLITAVPQRPHLFNTSIRTNILLGAPDANDNLLREALEDSGLSPWIATLPDGIDTVVGVAGSSISGGEAKRIALARALLHDAPIILLDEPTEGLDVDTETRIVERLNKRLQGKTVLLSAHRPACLALAERVIRL